MMPTSHRENATVPLPVSYIHAGQPAGPQQSQSQPGRLQLLTSYDSTSTRPTPNTSSADGYSSFLHTQFPFAYVQQPVHTAQYTAGVDASFKQEAAASKLQASAAVIATTAQDQAALGTAGSAVRSSTISPRGPQGIPDVIVVPSLTSSTSAVRNLAAAFELNSRLSSASTTTGPRLSGSYCGQYQAHRDSALATKGDGYSEEDKTTAVLLSSISAAPACEAVNNSIGSPGGSTHDSTTSRLQAAWSAPDRSASKGTGTAKNVSMVKASITDQSSVIRGDITEHTHQWMAPTQNTTSKPSPQAASKTFINTASTAADSLSAASRQHTGTDVVSAPAGQKMSAATSPATALVSPATALVSEHDVSSFTAIAGVQPQAVLPVRDIPLRSAPAATVALKAVGGCEVAGGAGSTGQRTAVSQSVGGQPSVRAHGTRSVSKDDTFFSASSKLESLSQKHHLSSLTSSTTAIKHTQDTKPYSGSVSGHPSTGSTRPVLASLQSGSSSTAEEAGVLHVDGALADAAALEEDLATVMKRLPASLKYGAREGATSVVSMEMIHMLYRRLQHLQSLLHLKDIEAQNATRNVELLQAQIANGQAGHGSLHQQLSDAQRQLIFSEQQRVQANQQLQDAQQELAEHGRELVALKQQMVEQNQKLQAAEQQLLSQQGQLDDARQQISARDEQLQEASRKLQEAEQQLVFHKEELEEAHGQLASQDDLLMEASEKLAATEQQSTACVEQFQDTAHKLEAAEARLAEYQQKAQAQVNTVSASGVTDAPSVNSLQTALETMSLDLAERDQQLQQALAALQARELELREAKYVLKASERELASQISAAATKLLPGSAAPRIRPGRSSSSSGDEAHGADDEDLQAESSHASDVNYAGRDDRAAELTAQLAAVTVELQQQKAVMDALRGDAAAAHQDMQAQQEACMMLQQQLDQVQQQLVMAQADRQQLQQQLAVAKAQAVSSSSSTAPAPLPGDGVVVVTSLTSPTSAPNTPSPGGAGGGTVPIALANQWRQAVAQERAERQALAAALEQARAELAISKRQAARDTGSRSTEVLELQTRLQHADQLLHDTQKSLRSTEARLMAAAGEMKAVGAANTELSEQLSAEQDAVRGLKLQVSVMQGSIDVLQKALSSAREDLAHTRQQQLEDAQVTQTVRLQVEELSKESETQAAAAGIALERLARLHLDHLTELRNHRLILDDRTAGPVLQAALSAVAVSSPSRPRGGLSDGSYMAVMQGPQSPQPATTITVTTLGAAGPNIEVHSAGMQQAAGHEAVAVHDAAATAHRAGQGLAGPETGIEGPGHTIHTEQMQQAVRSSNSNSNSMLALPSLSDCSPDVSPVSTPTTHKHSMLYLNSNGAVSQQSARGSVNVSRVSPHSPSSRPNLGLQARYVTGSQQEVSICEDGVHQGTAVACGSIAASRASVLSSTQSVRVNIATSAASMSSPPSGHKASVQMVEVAQGRAAEHAGVQRPASTMSAAPVTVQGSTGQDESHTAQNPHRDQARPGPGTAAETTSMQHLISTAIVAPASPSRSTPANSAGQHASTALAERAAATIAAIRRLSEAHMASRGAPRASTSVPDGQRRPSSASPAAAGPISPDARPSVCASSTAPDSSTVRLAAASSTAPARASPTASSMALTRQLPTVSSTALDRSSLAASSTAFARQSPSISSATPASSTAPAQTQVAITSPQQPVHPAHVLNPARPVAAGGDTSAYRVAPGGRDAAGVREGGSGGVAVGNGGDNQTDAHMQSPVRAGRRHSPVRTDSLVQRLQRMLREDEGSSDDETVGT